MKSRAFTLIELLTVIAIIGILASIMIPVVSSVRNKARGAHCTSNFRQMGNALLMYIGEHKNTLPGPVSAGQAVFYTLNSDGEITKTGGVLEYLFPYLNEPARPAGATYNSVVFLCPSWVLQRSRDGVNISGLFISGQAYQADTEYMGPWGGTRPPRQISMVPSLSRIWAIRETDKDATYAGKGSDNGGRLISKPAHDSYRNNLYYDGHVSPRRLDDEPINPAP
ncbi:type II secretion system protein [Geminisphaera colitermitum]|uniref:type II secretion system protein n=1 Tax=Geminisphaera colitermitum TaxID=1148786 RepID=UPI000158CCFA|nr:type II secretion system protein [Geminisphaera colitermitum]